MYTYAPEAALSIIAILLWYCFSLKWSFGKKGLDPALITHINPLGRYNFWVARIWLLLAAICVLLAPHASIALLFSCIGFALAHIALLLLFDRTATQPLVYYVFLLPISAVLISQTPAGIIIAIFLCMLQEYALRLWRTTQGQRYHKWVKRSTLSIHTAYAELAQTMTTKEWFYILHIAVTENIARPRIVRIAERIYFYIKRPKTISTGIMQVRADHPLSDQESMAQGARKVQKALQALPKEVTAPSEKLKWLAKHYNGSTTYTKYLHSTYPGFMMAWQEIDPTLANHRR